MAQRRIDAVGAIETDEQGRPVRPGVVTGSALAGTLAAVALFTHVIMFGTAEWRDARVTGAWTRTAILRMLALVVELVLAGAMLTHAWRVLRGDGRTRRNAAFMAIIALPLLLTRPTLLWAAVLLGVVSVLLTFSPRAGRWFSAHQRPSKR